MEDGTGAGSESSAVSSVDEKEKSTSSKEGDSSSVRQVEGSTLVLKVEMLVKIQAEDQRQVPLNLF